MKRKLQVVVARGILGRVPAQASFWLCTNQSIRSIAEVPKALQQATDDVFRYHVNRDKNDFEIWIRDTVKDKDLAREIARVKTRDTLIRKISERVASLQRIAKKAVPNGKRRDSRTLRRKSRSRRKQRR